MDKFLLPPDYAKLLADTKRCFETAAHLRRDLNADKNCRFVKKYLSLMYLETKDPKILRFLI